MNGVVASKFENNSDFLPGLLLVLLLLASMMMWLLAFWHLPSEAPEWLLRTRAVCFGINGNGLPDFSGWIMLVGAPLLFFSTLYIAYGGELFSSIRSSSVLKVVLFFVMTLAAFEGVWAGKRFIEGYKISSVQYENIEAEALPAHYPRGSEKAPWLPLVNQHGKSIKPNDLPPHPVLLTFAFAHCQTICPAVVSTTTAAIREFSEEEVSLMIVTLDPWRDTPQSLPSLASKWKLPENANVLSGDIETVQKFIESYKLPTSRDMKTGDITHPGMVYIIDTNGALRFTFNNPSRQWLVDALKESTVPGLDDENV